MDLKISGGSDLVVDNGDLVLVDGVESISQHLRIRLRFFKGEWFLDERIGLPFYDSILVKRPNLDVVRSILREAIVTCPGVEALETLDLDFDATTRQLSVELVAVAEGEGLFTFTEQLIV